MAPPHVPVSPFGKATCKPEGSVSENATFDSAAVALGLTNVKVSEVAAPTVASAVPNA